MKEKKPLSRKSIIAGQEGPRLAASTGPALMTDKEKMDYIRELERIFSQAGDDAQLANVDLQNMLQKQQKTLQMMSDISKELTDTAMAVIRKIGG